MRKRQRGQSAIKPSPRGTYHRVVVDQFQEPQPQISQQAANPAEESELTEVSLTEEEFKLQPASKHLRLYMKRNHGNYEKMKLSEVEKHLKGTTEDMPFVAAGTVATATVVHVTKDLFYLQWQDQWDRLTLVSGVLTALDKMKQLTPISIDRFPGQTLEGKLVAAPRSEDGWALVRGFVCKMISRHRVNVHFIDFGDNRDFEIGNLRFIPAELNTSVAPPMCFPAVLDLKEMSLGYESKPVVQEIFQRLVVGKVDVRVEIQQVINHGNVLYAYQVALWRLDSEDVDVSYEITKYIQDEVVKRRLPSMMGNSLASRTLDQACSQLHLDCEVDVIPYVDKYPKQVKLYRFVNVISPSEVYVQHCCEGTTVPKWYMEMQSFYNDPKSRYSYRIRTQSLCKNRCYVWQDRDDVNQTWHRVRVINFTTPMAPFNQARLWLLDEGKYVDGGILDMMELHKKFAFGALACRAFLCHIQPLPEENRWNDQLLRKLRNYCAADKLFDGVAIKMWEYSEGILEGPADSKKSESYGMIFAESSPNENLGTVQAYLTKAGLVAPRGLAAGRHDLGYMLTGEPYYCREKMETQLKLKIPEDMDYEQTELQRFDRMRLVSEKSEFHLASCMQMKTGFVRISRVISPDNFFIQMESKYRELCKMEGDLAIVITNFPVLSAKEIYPGMMCAGRVNQECEFPWSRVAILSVDLSKNRCNAILIDHGLEQYVDLSTVRKLPPYFEEIPPFCHRAHLDFSTKDNLCEPSSFAWEDDGCWRRYIHCWDGTQGTVYYAWQLRPGGKDSVIPLEEFNQVLNFDHTSMTWYAGKLIKVQKYMPLNKRRDHPLLKQFFSSIGIDLIFEWECVDFTVSTSPAWELLKDLGHVVSILD